MKKPLSVLLAAVMVMALLPTAGFPTALMAEPPEVLVSGDWQYTVENNKAALVAYTGDALTVKTPATVEGLPVTALSGTFKDNTDIVSASVSSGVTVIGEGAFQGCSKLVFVSVSSTVRTIGEGAFQDCARLMSVILPNSVTTVEKQAFMGCSSLDDVVLGSGLRTIGEDVFRNCTALETFTIPSNITSIHGSAFAGCFNMVAFEVDENSNSFSVIDGVLFNRSATTLVRYPAAKPDKAYKIDNTVTRIAAHAFDSAVHLESVTIPSTVVTVENSVFLGSALETIKIDRAKQGNLVWPEIGLYQIIWLQKPVTVMFDADDANIFSQTLVYGETVTKPSDPAKPGYRFIGWFDGEGFWDFEQDTVGPERIVLTAKWALQTSFTVTFKDGGEVLEVQKVNEGEAASAPAHPSKTGYAFAAWNRPFDCITEDIAVYTTWEINNYTVIFADGDTVMDTQTVEHGGTAAASANPAKTGFRFAGWDQPLSGINDDLTVKALWTATESNENTGGNGQQPSQPANEYTVVFVDGAKTLNEQTVQSGGSAIAPKVSPKTGYSFAGKELKMDSYQNAQTAQDTPEFNLDVKVFPIAERRGRTMAFASVGIEGLVAIRGIQVIEGNKGPIVSMPQSRGGDRKFHDIAFPLDGDLRKQITRDVLAEYGRAAEITAEKQQSLADKMREGAAKVAAQAADPNRASGRPAKGAEIA